ncbi:MAG: hypothetical protein CL928_19530 [Deltaproteobacteria bacterium]|nr:hypothetical protein [Deltaproteobacteria bacterium]
MLWSVDGVAQPAVSVGSTPLAGTAWFDVQLDGTSAGQTYALLFAIQDADGNQSEGYFLTATAS